MTRGKRIALVLGGIGAVLALLVVAQQAGLGRGYSKLAAEDDAAAGNFGRIDVDPVKMAAFAEYGDIVSRPVFNESRAPEAQPTGPAEGEATAEAAAQPLNVTLTGVMLMPTLQIAFVRDNTTSTVHRVRVGNPLEGDQSGWKLVELMPRKAVFEGEGLGRQEIELTVDTAGAPPSVPIGAPKPEGQPGIPGQPAVAAGQPHPIPGQPPIAGQPPAPGGVQPTEQPAATSADQIRQRIEERRRQLREEAQRMMQDQNKQQ